MLVTVWLPPHVAVAAKVVHPVLVQVPVTVATRVTLLVEVIVAYTERPFWFPADAVAVCVIVTVIV